jgi:hypothetical protein
MAEDCLILISGNPETSGTTRMRQGLQRAMATLLVAKGGGYPKPYSRSKLVFGGIGSNEPEDLTCTFSHTEKDWYRKKSLSTNC